MEVSKFLEPIKTSFDYPNRNGQTEKIKLTVKQLTFAMRSSDEFQTLQPKAIDDKGAAAEFLLMFLIDWNLYDDERETIKTAITKENLLKFPDDFFNKISETVARFLMPKGARNEN